MISTIEKPCIRRCCLNNDDICVGCFRSLNDMKQWHKSSMEVKKKILEDANKRKKSYRLKYSRGNSAR